AEQVLYNKITVIDLLSLQDMSIIQFLIQRKRIELYLALSLYLEAQRSLGIIVTFNCCMRTSYIRVIVLLTSHNQYQLHLIFGSGLCGVYRITITSHNQYQLHPSWFWTFINPHI